MALYKNEIYYTGIVEACDKCGHEYFSGEINMYLSSRRGKTVAIDDKKYKSYCTGCRDGSTFTRKYISVSTTH